MFENTPVDVIDMKIYGTIDGKSALEKAMGMIKK
jgi:PTS system cellobiose-specific IIB component